MRQLLHGADAIGDVVLHQRLIPAADALVVTAVDHDDVGGEARRADRVVADVVGENVGEDHVRKPIFWSPGAQDLQADLTELTLGGRRISVHLGVRRVK